MTVGIEDPRPVGMSRFEDDVDVRSPLQPIAQKRECVREVRLLAALDPTEIEFARVATRRQAKPGVSKSENAEFMMTSCEWTRAPPPKRAAALGEGERGCQLAKTRDLANRSSNQAARSPERARHTTKST